MTADRHLRLVHDAEAESRARVLEAARERPAHALWALLQELDATGVWEGAVAEITRRLGVSESTVSRHRRELEAQGVLLVESRPGRPSLWLLLEPFVPPVTNDGGSVTPPSLVNEITSDTPFTTPVTMTGVGTAHHLSSSSSGTPFTPRSESGERAYEAHSGQPADPRHDDGGGTLPPSFVKERTSDGGGSGSGETPARWLLRHRVHPTTEVAHLVAAVPIARVEAAWERMRHYSGQYGRELPAGYLAESLRKERTFASVPDAVVGDLLPLSEPSVPVEADLPSAGSGRPEHARAPRGGWGRALLLLAGAAVVVRRWW